MKKKTSALLAALMMSLTLGTAGAEETLKIDGTVEAAQKLTLLAPYSGVVGDYEVDAGDAIDADETLFTIRSTAVYADYDGTVTAVFAQPGDSAAVVNDRYGALCYMEQTTLYTADCSTSGADTDNDNRIVHVGEVVYIRSSSNTKRTGVARVTNVTGTKYTLEVLSDKDMRVNESIKVFREDNYDYDSCIGSGKLQRVDPKAITAEGYVLAVHVMQGQQVSRGDLLFDMVPDALEGMMGGDGSIAMPQDGVLLSVSAERGMHIDKDAPMATYCPKDAVELVCEVDEDDLPQLAVGDVMQVTLDAYPDQVISGKVKRIAQASTQDEDTFRVRIELDSMDNVRIGMSASAVK